MYDNTRPVLHKQAIVKYKRRATIYFVDLYDVMFFVVTLFGILTLLAACVAWGVFIFHRRRFF